MSFQGFPRQLQDAAPGHEPRRGPYRDRGSESVEPPYPDELPFFQRALPILGPRDRHLFYDVYRIGCRDGRVMAHCGYPYGNGRHPGFGAHPVRQGSVGAQGRPADAPPVLYDRDRVADDSSHLRFRNADMHGVVDVCRARADHGAHRVAPFGKGLGLVARPASGSRDEERAERRDRKQ